MQPVRVRYAPSPTGLQHIGGIRTALFNYFFARASAGKFLLRIEDTDQARYNAEAEEDLYETLSWLGISWDEGPRVGGEFGPYIQSQRTDLYQKYAKKLIEDGKAYYCYCSSERLERIRKLKEANKMPPGYDRHCAHLSEAEKEEAERSGVKPVIRLSIPLEGETSFQDLLLGKITWPNKDISPDPILMKSDGLPTYHLANVVDDHLMQISHVLRAQEWVSSGPFHVRLYEAFGWTPPIYCHLPMVMGSDGQKLSKRHGSTAVRQFREGGYLPEAIVNYITLLGWSFDDKTEFFTKEELEKVFNLERLNKSPAIFDYKKLDWFNAHYIRQLTSSQFADYVFKEIASSGYKGVSQELVEKSLPLIQDRVKTLKEIPAMLRFLLEPITTWDLSELLGKKLTKEVAQGALKELLVITPGFATRTVEENEARMQAKAQELGVPFAVLMVLLRVATLGSRVSPPLFPSMDLLGETQVLARIAGANAFIEKSGV
jgi:glutamyl-tRNA synthetase